MFKKKSISPNKLRIITLLTTGFLLLGINAFLSNFAFNKINSKSEKQFLDKFALTSDGYAKAVDQMLLNGKTLLNAYDSMLLSTQSSKDIQKYLVKTSHKIPKDFASIFFCDMNGHVYAHDGKEYDVEEPERYDITVKNSTTFFVTAPFKSLIHGNYVIAYGKMIYDKNGKKKGVLCLTMDISTFRSIVSKIKIGDTDRFVIQDIDGIVIYHTDSNYLNSRPKMEDIKLISGDAEEFQNMTTGILTLKPAGKHKVLVFFNKLKECPLWYLALVVPEHQYKEFRNTQSHYRILIVLLSALSIILVLVAELFLTHILQKKQLIATIYDPLTNLYTKTQFEIEASRLLRRYRNGKFMIIDADIHNFRFINQNYGTEKADQLIVDFSKMLVDYVNLNNGIICRSYADHFFAIIRISSVHKAMDVFKNTSLKLTETVKTHEIPFFPKFGVTFRLPDSKKQKGQNISIQALMDQATFAKSAIKNNALSSYAIYDSALLKKINDEHYIESHMIQALKDGEFFVMYQPKIDLLTDKIAGAEALVRWNSSQLGLLPPAKFIPLFEKNDFVKELDFFVYEKVFQFLRNCLDHNIPVVPISLNMSRNHSKPEVFMHRFMEIFSKYNLPSSLIEVEILERSVMSRETLIKITNMLHQEGFKVAMDDFGSGESSLNMLTNIPVDVLKFDKSFLDAAQKQGHDVMDKNAADLIAGLITLGRQLKKQTLFEGVETALQRDFLKSINCDLVQGYLYSRPINEEDFINFVKERC